MNTDKNNNCVLADNPETDLEVRMTSNNCIMAIKCKKSASSWNMSIL